MRRILLMWLLITTVLSGVNAQTQTRTISGMVTNELGEVIPGANVIIQGTTYGTVTDFEGRYSLSVDRKKKSLIFSFIGMEPKTVSIEGRDIIDVTLSENTKDLEEVVVVGYGTQKRISVTGSVESVKADELVQAPTASIATALTGQMPGLTIVQNSGAAGAQAASINIRGTGTLNNSSPLVLVDGIERDFQDLDMDEVASISVLKDASATAVYGIRGANGVIIVTTKRGKNQKPKISFNANCGLVRPGDMIETLDSYEYATLYNEGQINDGAATEETVQYSQEDLELYKNGTDPLMHPSHRWWDEITDDYATRSRYTLGINGGTEKLRYFVSLGYNREGDVFKDWDLSYDDGSWYERYNVRSNIDLDLTSTTLFSLDFGGQFSNRHKPDYTLENLPYDALRTPPMAMTIDDQGRIVKTDRSLDTQSPVEALYDNGYAETYTNNIQFKVTLKQQLKFITEGLSAKAEFAYDHGYKSALTASKSKPVYYISLDEETSEYIYEQHGYESKLGNKRETETKAKSINFRAFLNYARSFNKHNVSGVGVFTASSKSYSEKQEKYIPRRYLESAMRISYNYDERYFIEGNAAYNGSENFHQDRRFGFFPSVSTGYVLSNEVFWPKNKTLTFLKLRGSYGITGNDKISGDRFYPGDSYSIDPDAGYYFGITPGRLGNAVQTQLGNQNVTWEKNYQQNYGINTEWFKSKLKIDSEYFKTRREDILIIRNNVSDLIGTELPPANLGIVENEGYELSMAWNDKIGKVGYFVKGAFSYADNKVIYKDEVPTPYPWMEETGHDVKVKSGFVCEGFYTQEEADEVNEGNYTTENPLIYSGTAHAGDLKYKDLDGDGKITDYDVKVFDGITSIPKINYSFTLGLKYKGWSASSFFQGAEKVTYEIMNLMRVPFTSGYTNAPTYVLGRWTPETAETGTFPRISATGSKSAPNYQNSDFWIHDASYLRLKNVEVAYTFKKEKLKRLGMSSCKLYANGTNLYTWTNLDFIDPEAKQGDKIPMPPNSVYTLGVKIGF